MNHLEQEFQARTGAEPRTQSPGIGGVSVDELFANLGECVRLDHEQALPFDAQLAARAKALTEKALRLNDTMNPALAPLVRSMVGLASRKLFTGQIVERCEPNIAFEREPQEASVLAQQLSSAIESSRPPESYQGFIAAMNSPISNATHVAEAMVDSPGISGFVLTLVNSPLYGLSSPVTSLSRAVAMAGFNEISILVLAVVAARNLRGIGQGARDDFSFWMRSMACGLYARRLALAAGLPGEWFFGAGLVADIGALTARRFLPLAHETIETLISRSSLTRFEAETVVLGESLAGFGSKLLLHWGVPARLASLISLRSEPGRDPSLCVLHLAEILTEASSIGTKEAKPVSRLDHRALEVLNLGPEFLDVDRADLEREAAVLTRAFLAR